MERRIFFALVREEILVLSVYPGTGTFLFQCCVAWLEPTTLMTKLSYLIKLCEQYEIVSVLTLTVYLLIFLSWGFCFYLRRHECESFV